MSAGVLLLTALAALAGSFVQSASGLGYAIVCMTFWPMLFPFRTASTIECIAAFFMVVYLAVRLRRHIRWDLLWPPAVVSVLFGALGVDTLMQLSDSALRRILGAALLVLAVYFVFFSHRVHLRPNLITGLAAGVISGFCSGLFNIGGPPMVAYYLSVAQDKESYNATLQAYFCLTSFSLFAIHLLHGNVTAEMLPLTAAALAGTAVGTLAGSAAFRRMSLEHIKKFVYGFMTVAGVYLVVFG